MDFLHIIFLIKEKGAPRWQHHGLRWKFNLAPVSDTSSVVGRLEGPGWELIKTKHVISKRVCIGADDCHTNQVHKKSRFHLKKTYTIIEQ